MNSTIVDKISSISQALKTKTNTEVTNLLSETDLKKSPTNTKSQNSNQDSTDA